MNFEKNEREASFGGNTPTYLPQEPAVHNPYIVEDVVQQQPYGQPPPNYFVKDEYDRKEYFTSSSSSSSSSLSLDDYGKQGAMEEQIQDVDPYYVICKETPVKIRHSFIVKVFSLVGISLVWAFGICLIVNFIPEAKEAFKENWWIITVSVILMLIISIVMFCNRRVATRVPINYILLALYSTCSGCLLAGVGSYTDTIHVLVPTVAAVLFVCCLCLILGFQTKVDFTSEYCFIGVGVGLLGLLMFNCLGWFLFANSTVEMVVGSIGVLIFSLLLVIDVQMIVGHKHRVRFTIDEYANAALQIHTDVINMFLYMLRFMGAL